MTRVCIEKQLLVEVLSSLVMASELSAAIDGMCRMQGLYSEAWNARDAHDRLVAQRDRLKAAICEAQQETDTKERFYNRRQRGE